MKTRNYLFLLPFLLLSVHSLAQTILIFEPDKDLRKSIKKETWANLKAATPPSYQGAMSGIFFGNLPFSNYRSLTRQYGYDSNNMATAQTTFKVFCWEAIHNILLDKSAIKAIYTQSEQNLPLSLAKKNAAEKQEMADPWILKSIWLGNLLQKIRQAKDTRSLQMLQKIGANWFEALMGSPASQFQLTAQGLEKRDGPPMDQPSVEPESTSAVIEEPVATTSPPITSNAPAIKDIIMRTETRYGLGGTYVENVVYLFLADGSYRTDPSESPDQLNVKVSKSKYPKKWGRWQLRNGTYTLTRYNGKQKTFDKWFEVRPAQSGLRLQGQFKTYDAFTGATIINASRIAFNAQGQFVWSTVKGGQTAWQPTYSKSEMAGTYQVNGHSITLKYNSGRTESFFFGLYPKKNDYFIIGSSHFVPIKN